MWPGRGQVWGEIGTCGFPSLKPSVFPWGRVCSLRVYDLMRAPASGKGKANELNKPSVKSILFCLSTALKFFIDHGHTQHSTIKSNYLLQF